MRVRISGTISKSSDRIVQRVKSPTKQMFQPRAGVAALFTRGQRSPFAGCKRVRILGLESAGS